MYYPYFCRQEKEVTSIKCPEMNDSKEIAQPFNKAQLELLYIFSFDIPEEQYAVLKTILLRFKAEVLMDKADQIALVALAYTIAH